MGPPSHSRLINLADLESQQHLDESSMAKDDEISRMFKDKFNVSILESERSRRPFKAA